MNNASIRAILQDLKNSIAKLEAALEIDSSGTKENTPWYPPEKFGPWIETHGNTITDVPQDQKVQLLTRWQRINKCGPMHIMLMRTVREDHEKGLRLFPDFVAYRIVL